MIYRDPDGAWRKSTHSSNANNCVEVTNWRKSTRSNNNTACVEVGSTPSIVAVRDTKHREGGHLAVAADEWQGFLATFKK